MTTTTGTAQTSKSDRWLAAFAKASCQWPLFVPMSVGRIRTTEPRR